MHTLRKGLAHFEQQSCTLCAKALHTLCNSPAQKAEEMNHTIIEGELKVVQVFPFILFGRFFYFYYICSNGQNVVVK